MTVFSPNGRYLLVANEGEPTDDYCFDGEGSVTVVHLGNGGKSTKSPSGTDLSHATVRTAGFRQFNNQRDELIARGVHLFGPSHTHADGLATVAEDLEPEYIAVSSDSRRAWVSLQENNAIAEVDLTSAQVTAIHPLGVKDFRHLPPTASASGLPMQTSTGLDTSDEDGGSRIRCWPVYGLFQPDSLAYLRADRGDYLLTANEGDPRNYLGYRELRTAAELKTAAYRLDPKARWRAMLTSSQLGRLEISPSAGDIDGDGDLDQLRCFGTRSFAVWRVRNQQPLELVFDSGQRFRAALGQLGPRAIQCR